MSRLFKVSELLEHVGDGLIQTNENVMVDSDVNWFNKMLEMRPFQITNSLSYHQLNLIWVHHLEIVIH